MKVRIETKHVIYLLIPCIIIFFAFVVLLLTGKVFPYSSTEFGNWAMWVGAIASVFAAIGTVGSLMFLILDNRQKRIGEHSKDALDSYRSSIQNLISHLKNTDTTTDSKWLVISTTYYELMAYLKEINVESHKELTKIAFSSLKPHLDLFYANLDQHDFLTISEDLELRYSLKDNNQSISASAQILATTWLKYMAGKSQYYTDVGLESYEYTPVLKRELVLALIAMLCGKNGEMLDMVTLGRQLSFLKQNLRTEELDISHSIFDTYALLLAHILLCDTYRVKKSVITDTLSVPLPQLTVYGPEESWVVIKHNVIFYPKSIFNRNAYIVKHEKGDKMKISGGIRILHK